MSAKYRTIVADPPWTYRDPFGGFNAGGKGKMVRRRLPYSAMSVEEIAGLAVEDLAADDANLFLWTTNRYLREAFEIVDAWGFIYKQLLVWHKTGARPNSGSIAPTSCEFVLFARRGRSVDKARLPDALLTTKRIANAHSTKPDAFLDLVESVSQGPYLELFARRARFGWDYWGDESLNTADIEGVRLAIEHTAMSMASKGKRVWEPLRTEDSDRIADLYYRANRERDF